MHAREAYERESKRDGAAQSEAPRERLRPVLRQRREQPESRERAGAVANGGDAVAVPRRQRRGESARENLGGPGADQPRQRLRERA
jgi:hypothetical protein